MCCGPVDSNSGVTPRPTTRNEAIKPAALQPEALPECCIQQDACCLSAPAACCEPTGRSKSALSIDGSSQPQPQAPVSAVPLGNSVWNWLRDILRQPQP